MCHVPSIPDIVATNLDKQMFEISPGHQHQRVCLSEQVVGSLSVIKGHGWRCPSRMFPKGLESQNLFPLHFCNEEPWLRGWHDPFVLGRIWKIYNSESPTGWQRQIFSYFCGTLPRRRIKELMLGAGNLNVSRSSASRRTMTH